MAQARLLDDNGYGVDPQERPPQGSGLDSQQVPVPNQTPQNKSGGSAPSGVPQDWYDDFVRRNPGDGGRAAAAYAPTSHRTSDSQGSGFNQATNQPTGIPQPLPARAGAQQATNVPSQFSDPITSFIEQFAQQRAQALENPAVGSGQQLLEQALKDISAQFQKGGYTNAEQEVFQTQALDPLEQLRQARKRQVIEDLSRRGIDPKSGVAIQMIQDVDRQFDGQRAMTQRSIASQGAQETQQRMMQALQMLGTLSGTENSRMNEAFQYRSVPLNLADRSFNQASQLYNMAGNPMQMVNPLMQLGQQQQGRSDQWQEALGYLAAILAQQG
jgi:hypothetical protein